MSSRDIVAKAADALRDALRAHLSGDDTDSMMDAFHVLIDAKIDAALADHARRYKHDFDTDRDY